MEQKNGIKQFSDILSTFGSTKVQNQVSEFMIEGSIIQVIEKNDVITFASQHFNKFNLGEYNSERLAQATHVLTTLGTGDLIPYENVVEATAQGIVRLTKNINYDFSTKQIRKYLYTKIEKNLELMKRYGLVESVGDKLRRGEFEIVDIPTIILGSQLYHGLGKSSARRALVLSEIAVIEQGIEKSYLTQKLNTIRELRVPHDAVEKTLLIHGVNGSGYILSTTVGGTVHPNDNANNYLVRLYKRTDSSYQNPDGFLNSQDAFKMVNFITKTPAVPDSVLRHSFGNDLADKLQKEASDPFYHHTNAILIKRGESYFTGQHVDALRLKHCELENNPIITLIADIYEQFTPKDAPTIALLSKNVFHRLVSDHEYPIPSSLDAKCESVRKILWHLERRGIVMKNEHQQKYDVVDYGSVRWGSNILGNVLD